MAQALPKFDSTLLRVLARGAEKAFENAENLYREARILADADAIERALFLHQISLEECSKVENMGAWAMSLISGHKINLDKALAAFTRHASKNYSNAYMLEGSQAEKDAKERGDWKTALNEFRKLQKEFHEKSNNAKNASLYVDWKDGEFIAPRERISAQMLKEITDRNESFLSYAYNSLRMLKRLQEEPAEMQRMAMKIEETAKKLREKDSADVTSAMTELIREFLTVEYSKRTS